MLEKILNFITPGPLNERFGFGARVFSSWISLGLGLGLVNILISGLGGTLSWETVVGGFIGGLVLSCGYGLIGVGIDFIRGRRVEYPGWYWWVFPIATFLSILLSLTFGLFGIFLAFAGIKLPKLPDFGDMPRTGHNTNQPLVDNWIKQNAEQKADDFIKKNPKIKPQNSIEKSVHQKFIENPEKTIDEIISQMSEEEFQAFIEMLMSMLGIRFIS